MSTHSAIIDPIPGSFTVTGSMNVTGSGWLPTTTTDNTTGGWQQGTITIPAQGQYDPKQWPYTNQPLGGQNQYGNITVPNFDFSGVLEADVEEPWMEADDFMMFRDDED